MSVPNTPAQKDMSSLEDLDEAPRRGKFSSFYRVSDEVLGTGVSGEVKLAVNRQTGGNVALKTYKPAEMSRSAMNDLAREIQIQGSVEHPSVAKLEAVFFSSETVHLLVEHLEGGEVFEHLVREGPLGEGQAARVMSQLLRAIEHLHAQGIVHRDIKPENMMYTSSDKDTVKLIDFGFCTRWKDGDKPMTRRCGTDGYMAPEVLQQRYTNMADMWSVGVVAHSLLTGNLVGRKIDWSPVFAEGLAKCSLEAQKFVAALVAVEPGARLTAQEALGHCWLLGQDESVERSKTCSTDVDCGRETSESSWGGSSWVSAARSFCNAPTDRSEFASTRANTSRAEFSSLFPAEPDSPKQGKKWNWQHRPSAEPDSPKSPQSPKSIWQALPSRLPTLKVGAHKKVSAVPAAFRDRKSQKASRVSVGI